MGGGRKDSDDVIKSRPVSILAEMRKLQKEGAELGGGVGPEAASFCAQTHIVPLDVAPGAVVQPGMPVTLAISNPPQVIQHDQVIGVVSTSFAASMVACIQFGYLMAGTVATLDGNGKGTLRISGEQQHAAA